MLFWILRRMSLPDAGGPANARSLCESSPAKSFFLIIVFLLGGFWEGFAAFGLLVLFLHGVLPAGVFFGPVLQLPLGLPVACLLGGVEPYSFVCVVNLVFFVVFFGNGVGSLFPLSFLLWHFGLVS